MDKLQILFENKVLITKEIEVKVNDIETKEIQSDEKEHKEKIFENINEIYYLNVSIEEYFLKLIGGEK